MANGAYCRPSDTSNHRLACLFLACATGNSSSFFQTFSSFPIQRYRNFSPSSSREISLSYCHDPPCTAYLPPPLTSSNSIYLCTDSLTNRIFRILVTFRQHGRNSQEPSLFTLKLQECSLFASKVRSSRHYLLAYTDIMQSLVQEV